MHQQMWIVDACEFGAILLNFTVFDQLVFVCVCTHR